MSNILTTAKIGFEFTFECDPHQSTCWNSNNWTSSIKNDEAITPPLEEKYMASGNDKKDPFLSTPRIQATKAPRKSWGGAPFQDNREDRFPSWFSHVDSDVRDSKQFRQKHAAWLFQYPTWTQFQHDVSKQFGPYVNSMDDALHYQAINIEHLFEADESVRRMEFRFFKAQKDMNDIVGGLHLIDELVAMAERKLHP